MPRRPVRNRAVSNQRLKSQLSYVMRYPSYLEGELAVEAEAAGGAPQPAKAEAPKAEAPKAEVPKVEAPKVEAPKVEANLLILRWTHTARETISELIGFLDAQKKEARIQGCEPLLLDASTLQGLFVIRGTPAQLDALQSHAAWTSLLARLQGVSQARGFAGDAVLQLLGR